MILFTRAVAQNFRVLFARCVAGRPRGPAPPVVIEVKSGIRTLASTTPEGVTLTHTSPAPGERDELLVLPGALLAEVEGGTDETVTLDRSSKVQGVVRWHGGTKPRTRPVELILPGTQHAIPSGPPLTSVPAPVLTALAECGRTAARENGRYALSRVQLQGRHGRVVATDGKVALLWAGFTFPFADDLLVPALPVFGAKPLARVVEVRIGRTETHLVIGAGPWSVRLPIESKAKFPDVAGVVPRYAPTTVAINAADAAMLLPRLPGLPGQEHELRPVTLDADGVLTIRADNTTGKCDAVVLARSRVTGPAARVVLDQRVLARMLALNCRALRLAPVKAVVATGDGVTVLAAPLDPQLAADTKNGTPATNPIPIPIPNTERTEAMKPHETNGHATHGRHDPPATDNPDPLVLAEELRAALGEALTKAGRLVAALKAGRKEKRALANVFSSLKQLNLD